MKGPMHATKPPRESMAQKMLRTSVYIYKNMCYLIYKTVRRTYFSLLFAIEHLSSAYKNILFQE